MKKKKAKKLYDGIFECSHCQMSFILNNEKEKYVFCMLCGGDIQKLKRPVHQAIRGLLQLYPKI